MVYPVSVWCQLRNVPTLVSGPAVLPSATLEDLLEMQVHPSNHSLELLNSNSGIKNSDIIQSRNLCKQDHLKCTMDVALVENYGCSCEGDFYFY